MHRIYPQIEGADDRLREICLEALDRKYSGDLKEKAIKNLEYELANIERQRTAPMYLIFNDMLKGVKAKKEEFFTRGMLSTLVISYILGFSSYEPLEIDPKVYSFFYIGMDGMKDPSFEITVTNALYERIIEYWKNYKGEVPYEKMVDSLDYLESGLEEKWTGVAFGEMSGQADTDDRARIVFIPVDKSTFGDGLCDAVREVCPHEKLKDYVKCFGLSRNFIWEDSAWKLYKDGAVPFEQLIANREDVYELLEEHDLLQAIEITEEVRKGRIKRKGWSKEQLELLRENNIPEWFIEACTKIDYLFPRAHAIEYYNFIHSQGEIQDDMIETICDKLGVNSIEEYLEKRREFFDEIDRKFKGCEVDYPNPLEALSFDELDFFIEYVDNHPSSNKQ